MLNTRLSYYSPKSFCVYLCQTGWYICINRSTTLFINLFKKVEYASFETPSPNAIWLLKLNDKNFCRTCFEKTLNIPSIILYRSTTYDICSWFNDATYKLSFLEFRFFSGLSLSLVWFSLNPAIVTSSSKKGDFDTPACLAQCWHIY